MRPIPEHESEYNRLNSSHDGTDHSQLSFKQTGEYSEEDEKSSHMRNYSRPSDPYSLIKGSHERKHSMPLQNASSDEYVSPEKQIQKSKSPQ